MELTDEQVYAIKMTDKFGMVMPSMAAPDLSIVKELKALGLLRDATVTDEGMFKGVYWPKLTPEGFRVKKLLSEPEVITPAPLGGSR